MIKSMTGFSRIEMECSSGRLYGEARSLNSRYLEINMKTPKFDVLNEQKLRELVKQYVKRGKVDISLKWERSAGSCNPLTINEDVLGQYLGIIRVLKEKYGLTGGLTAENIFNFKDIIIVEETNNIQEDAFVASFENLLMKLIDEKTKEGELIMTDLLGRLAEIGLTLTEIEERRPSVIKGQEMRLKEKIVEVTNSTSIDEMRVLQELALYMERLDISEEIVRLQGHLDNFRETLNAADPVGRKLDFIIQEMVREANTIGSKSCDLYINERVIKIKVEIEKMREQVQNVE